jgi:hypothetical protein
VEYYVYENVIKVMRIHAQKRLLVAMSREPEKAQGKRALGVGDGDVEREYICTYNEITKHERNCNIYTRAVS